MISAGDNHTAALTRDGRLFTWGTYKDSNGYIGYMPGVDKAKEPQQVLAGVPVGHVAAGPSARCGDLTPFAHDAHVAHLLLR